jgi:hypothetical protein
MYGRSCVVLVHLGLLDDGHKGGGVVRTAIHKIYGYSASTVGDGLQGVARIR